MRSLVFLFISLFVCLELNAQIIEEVDECFPFQGYFAAIKSGDKWGFINREGELVIKFRSDLVISKSNQNVCNAEFESATHPVISDNRCLIKNNRLPIKHKIGNRRIGDLDISYANADKIYREVGFKTEFDIDDMCRDGLTFIGL